MEATINNELKALIGYDPQFLFLPKPPTIALTDTLGEKTAPTELTPTPPTSPTSTASTTEKYHNFYLQQN